MWRDGTTGPGSVSSLRAEAEVVSPAVSFLCLFCVCVFVRLMCVVRKHSQSWIPGKGFVACMACGRWGVLRDGQAGGDLLRLVTCVLDVGST